MHQTTAIAWMLALAGPAWAGPQTWTFDETTSGEDIAWTSPTPVNPSAGAYRGDYVLTSITVTVEVFGLPVPVDVTDQVPPEALSGTGASTGPAPLVLIDELVIFPDPPEPPSIAASLFVGLDPDGFGLLQATDVILGTVDLGGLGVLQILALNITGEITVTPFDPADVNGDGVVDVNDLVGVVTGWGACPPDGKCPADTNFDGIVDVADLVQVILAWNS